MQAPSLAVADDLVDFGPAVEVVVFHVVLVWPCHCPPKGLKVSGRYTLLPTSSVTSSTSSAQDHEMRQGVMQLMWADRLRQHCPPYIVKFTARGRWSLAN
eukprot:3226276-Amphidinium_carterae.2